MRLAADGTLLLSPSDLSGHLACPHLTNLNLRVQRGELERPRVDDTHGDLIRRKGDEHEAAYLARLEAEGRSIVRIPTYDDEGFDADEARRLTEEAIRAGEAEVIYQPYLSDGTWRGFADFLERQPDGTYEAVDTKLARSAKPAHVLQLCFYSEQLGRIQGKLPEHFHVELGTGERETFRTAEYMAYFRRTRERFLGALETEPETYPWPCDHCGLCDFRNLCKQQLRDDDNLVLVAGLRRSYADILSQHEIPTLEALGRQARGLEVDGMRAETLETIRHQAELQLHYRETGEHRVDHLPDEEGRGFRLLPEPSFGDVWLDLEGHPFYEPARGLEYLFGWCYRDEDGTVLYEAAWARDRDGECEIFERFVDWMVERRRRYPGAHVYHYAAYERTALRRLMGEHGDARAGGRRLPAPRRARRPLPRRQAGAPCVGGELLDQGDRGAVRVRAHGRGHGRRRVDRPLREVARERRRLAAARHRGLQRGGLPLDGRAPRVAPAQSAARTFHGAPPHEPERARGGDAARASGPARRAARALGGGGRRAVAPRAAPRLPPPRGEAAVVGVVPPPGARRGRS